MKELIRGKIREWLGIEDDFLWNISMHDGTWQHMAILGRYIGELKRKEGDKKVGKGKAKCAKAPVKSGKK